MGRELKCPICLSLLNSAASLTCNHVFCNACIHASMKLVPNCPVCKVPYRPREIRPAPQMDNLVSIYKSLEAASGVNIFVTQTETSTKIAGEENKSASKTFGIEENDNIAMQTSEQNNEEGNEKRGSKRSRKTKNGNCNPSSVKPSFPTKKRVQVPQHPPLESPLPTKLVAENDQVTASEPQRHPVINKGKGVLNEKGELILSPFFWLRDDVEQSTQLSDDKKSTQLLDEDEDHATDTPPGVPCFSDMKDSDDEFPLEMTPKSAAPGDIPKDAEFFDSEMFEWTQRPCSPELLSSPLKLQVEDTYECEGLEQDTEATLMDLSILAEPKSHNRKSMDDENEMSKEEVSPPTLSSLRNGISKIKGGLRKSSKRVRMIESKKKNGRMRSIQELMGVPSGSQKAKLSTKDFSNDNALNMGKKSHDKKKEVGIGADSARVSLDQKEDSGGCDVKRNGKRRKVTVTQQQKVCNMSKSGKNAPKDRIIPTGDVAVNPYPLNTSAPINDDKEVTDSSSKVKSKVTRAGKSKNMKQVTFSEEIFEDNIADGIQKVNEKNSSKETLTPENISNSLCMDKNSLSKIKKSLPNSSSSVLQKCETHPTHPTKIQCAFCHTAEESEDSGVMMHYLNGKPIKEDQIGATSVIHVHKNCAEWAPNVYFNEDDDVVNLETELKRSRSISCAFCGVKGAALGCYEKTCRKSFHVPCAKMTPNCQWDHYNFVMLCPLHACCKLPCKEPEFQSKKKKKCELRNSCINQPQIAVKSDNRQDALWKSQRKNKSLVLCCSAITDAERALVSDFERLSGATVLKTWDPSVTHIIASTNEKGACKRTFKFLMGVLGGKWILTIEWIKACLNATELLDEQQYEIEVDTHGVRGGPRLGRLRTSNKQPKLFSGYKFYFMSDFLPSYKKYLHDLVVAAGGTVLNRKPVSEDEKSHSSGCSSVFTFIVYSLELPDNCKTREKSSILHSRRSAAEALASSTGSLAASNSWVLNCIAGCKLQDLE
nr:protein BREAST CANCER SUSCEPTIBILITY 1 homolog [Ipomoea batatas]